MERIISSEERIRRAEELYYRRRNSNLGISTNSIYRKNSKRKNWSLLKKTIVQVILCIIIYFCIYAVKYSNYIFSEDFLSKVNSILQYDVDFSKYYNLTMEYFNNLNKENKATEEENVQNNETTENTSSETQENIGGSDEKTEEKTEQNLSQMEIDANSIKNTYALIKPLDGTITSRFGQREPTSPNVPKNHTGIDIAATNGTPIVAALDGIVEVSSNQGDYGKHLKIKKDDVEIVYAHCSKLLKKEGDEVTQGEKIAEVGATGNATGPHLHFEIRKENRYINPDLILEF